MNPKARIILIVVVVLGVFAALKLTTRKSKTSVLNNAAGRIEKKEKPHRNYSVHVIGVQEGQPLPGEDTRVWWQKCPDTKNDRTGECHKKYAGQTYKTSVEVSLRDLQGEVILVAMSSNAKTRWDIRNLSGVNLVKVILLGVHEQTATGLSGQTQLEVYSSEPSPCENCYRGPPGPVATNFDERLTPVLERIQELTGNDPRSVQLVPKTASFSVSDNMRPFDRAAFEAEINKRKCGDLKKSMLDLEASLQQQTTSSDLDYYRQRLQSLREQSERLQCQP